jgi:hypothetical protein
MPPKSNRSFLVDENTSRTLASTLRAEGYSAEQNFVETLIIVEQGRVRVRR